MNEATTPRRYCAFLSYRRTDNSREGRRWAGWLQRELERYEVPADLIQSEKAKGRELPKSLYPVFRDEDSLPAGYDLGAWIKRGLERSEALIVLCSPRSVQSHYVRDEIRQFKEMGKAHRIQAVILDGEPNASIPELTGNIDPALECFPHELRFGVEDPARTIPGSPPFIDWQKATQPIAADLRPEGGHEQGFNTPGAYRQHLEDHSGLSPQQINERVTAYEERLRRAVCQIIAGLLEVDQEDIRNRDAEYRAQQARMEADRLRLRNRMLIIVGLVIVGLAALAAVLGWRAEQQSRERLVTLHRASATSLGNAGDMVLKDDWHRGTQSLIEAVDYEPENAKAARSLWLALAYPYGNHMPIPDDLVRIPGKGFVAALHPGGEFFAACDDDSSLSLRFMAAPDQVMTIVPKAELLEARRKSGFARRKPADSTEDSIPKLHWSPNGQYLLAEWFNDTVAIFHLEGGKLIPRRAALPAKIATMDDKIWMWFGSALLIQASKLHVTADLGTKADSHLGLLDLESGTWTEASFPFPERGMLLAVHPDLSKIAVVVGGKGIDILAWPGGELVRSERGDFKSLPLATFLKRSQEFVFTSSYGKDLEVSDLGSDSRSKTWRDSSEVISAMFLSPDERFVAYRLESDDLVVTDRQQPCWFLRLPHLAVTDWDECHIALGNDKLVLFNEDEIYTYRLPGIFRVGAAVPVTDYKSRVAWSADGQAIAVIERSGKKFAYHWPGLNPITTGEEPPEWREATDADRLTGRESETAFYLMLDDLKTSQEKFIQSPQRDWLASLSDDNVNGESRRSLLALPVPDVPPLGKDGARLLKEYEGLWDSPPGLSSFTMRQELHQLLVEGHDYPDLPVWWREFLTWWTTRPGERALWSP